MRQDDAATRAETIVLDTFFRSSASNEYMSCLAPSQKLQFNCKEAYKEFEK